MNLKREIPTAAMIISCLFAYLFLYKPALFYHHQQPMFLFQLEFLHHFLLYPGGILDWAFFFFTQFFRINWLGITILTALIVGNYVLIKRIFFNAFNQRNTALLALIPALLMLQLSINYNAPLVILFRMYAAHVILLLFTHSNRWKMLILLAAWPVYLLLGGVTFLYLSTLFVIFALIQEKGLRKNIFAALAAIAAFVCPFIASQHVFFITPHEAFFYLFPKEITHPPFLFKSDWLVICLFCAMPMLSLLVALLHWIQHTENKQRNDIVFLQNYIVQAVIILFACIAAIFGAANKDQEIRIRIDKAAAESHWTDVIQLAQALEDYDRDVNFQVNRARYFKHDLLENLFSYPQKLGLDGLFIHQYMVGTIALQAGELFYDLAMINASQIMAYEALTKTPYNPRLFKRLVYTNWIQGNKVLAESFLNILSTSPMHRKWAKNMLKRLHAGNVPKEIIEKRALCPQTDFLLSKSQFDSDLISILQEHPENRMAFEYLIACDLIEGNLVNVADRLRQFAAFGYKRIPRHVAEAMLLMKMMQSDHEILNRISFDPEMIKKFMTFNQVVAQNAQLAARAKNLLADQYDNTLWYYLRFQSSKNSGVKLTRRKIDDD